MRCHKPFRLSVLMFVCVCLVVCVSQAYGDVTYMFGDTTGPDSFTYTAPTFVTGTETLTQSGIPAYDSCSNCAPAGVTLEPNTIVFDGLVPIPVDLILFSQLSDGREVIY